MRTKKKRKRILLYKCTYCGDESNYSLTKLITHLDLNHKEITEADKNELIKNFNLEISRKNKPDKKELRRQKIKEQNKLKAENKSKELSEFKNKVLEALANSNIDKKKLEIIKSRKNIEKVKRILMFGLKKQFQTHLDNFGIDYKVLPKKKKGKIEPISKGTEIAKKEKLNKKVINKFISYRNEVIKCLNKVNISQKHINEILLLNDKKMIEKYVNKNLDKYIPTLKRNKIEPFYKVKNFYTKIIYTPMGNKI